MNLKQYRKEAGLTQKELAERVGCTIRYVQYIEAGVTPSLEVAKKFSDILKVSIDNIFFGGERTKCSKS